MEVKTIGVHRIEPDANLRKADLGHADLSGVNLEGANLSKANLYGANLTGAKLNHAVLREANVMCTHFENAVLDGADLLGVHIAEVTGLIDGGQDRRGYRIIGVRHKDGIMILAGCNWFNIKDARRHWGRHDSYSSSRDNSNFECLARVETIVAIARRAGWIIGDEPNTQTEAAQPEVKSEGFV